jgi:hypothetical protein
MAALLLLITGNLRTCSCSSACFYLHVSEFGTGLSLAFLPAL